jgi:hypothetical protein
MKYFLIVLIKWRPFCFHKNGTWEASKWASVEQRHCPHVFKSLVQEPSWLYWIKKQQDDQSVIEEPQHTYFQFRKYCAAVWPEAHFWGVLISHFGYKKVERGRAKHDWTKRTKRYYGITWKSQSNSHIAFGDISSVIPDDFFVLSKLTDSIIIGYFTGDIYNLMLNCGKNKYSKSRVVGKNISERNKKP